MENDKLKEALLQVLDKFIQICEAHHLRYYMGYGSVLGAIRHGGIIPWDDDIDVHMPREDYEKIQQLPKSVWGEMELTSWKLTPGNQYPFLKLENTNTTIIEQLYPLYVGGIYIDIFPLDNAPKDPEVFEKQISDICNVLKKYYIICTQDRKRYKGMVNYLKYRWRHFIYIHQHVQDEWDAISRREREQTGYVFTYYITDGYADGETNEYCLRLNDEDQIQGVAIGGADAWYMAGYAYFNSEFSKQYKELFEKEYADENTRQLYWEDIYIKHLHKLPLMRAIKMADDELYEFDSLDELRLFDEYYIADTRSTIIKQICQQLQCQEEELHTFRKVANGEGQTFAFMHKDAQYQYTNGEITKC